MKTKITGLVLGSLVLSFVLACGGGGNSSSGEGDSSGEHSSAGEHSSSGGSSTGGTGNGNYMLTAWNDLGMHCMDGKDFSVFSILPPYRSTPIISLSKTFHTVSIV